MWEYAIMSTLGTTGAVSQSELSARIRRDPTRLGRHLNDLAARGVIVRDRSTDQRLRTARLTAEG
ncbi:MarR family transcriptional regulator, partial [Phycicoccus jejuensis]|uniref:MarR family transcriptional regulator n=1 Tax=Phycicoccus jejuensis TaxID=367299 RepID=UPI0012FCB906